MECQCLFCRTPFRQDKSKGFPCILRRDNVPEAISRNREFHAEKAKQIGETKLNADQFPAVVVWVTSVTNKKVMMRLSDSEESITQQHERFKVWLCSTRLVAGRFQDNIFSLYCKTDTNHAVRILSFTAASKQDPLLFCVDPSYVKFRSSGLEQISSENKKHDWNCQQYGGVMELGNVLFKMQGMTMQDAEDVTALISQKKRKAVVSTPRRPALDDDEDPVSSEDELGDPENPLHVPDPERFEALTKPRNKYEAKNAYDYRIIGKGRKILKKLCGNWFDHHNTLDIIELSAKENGGKSTLPLMKAENDGMTNCFGGKGSEMLVTTFTFILPSGRPLVCYHFASWFVDFGYEWEGMQEHIQGELDFRTRRTAQGSSSAGTNRSVAFTSDF